MRRIDPPVQLARLALLVAILVLWHYAVEQEWLNRIFTATPKEVWDGFIDIVSTRLFWEDTVVTLREAVIGFVIGGALGLLVGLLAGRYDRIGKVFMPFLTFANALPKIALAPILLLWFGVGESSKIVLAAIVVFFIVQVPTQAAVRVDRPRPQRRRRLAQRQRVPEVHQGRAARHPGPGVRGVPPGRSSSRCCRSCSPRSCRPNAGSACG